MRPYRNPISEDQGCAALRTNYKSNADFNRWAREDIGRYVRAINSYDGYEVMRLKDSEDTTENNRYNTLISQIQIAETNLDAYIKCLQKDIVQRTDYSSRLYNLQQDRETARTLANHYKGIAKEAKERASDIENPYTKTTWWESWFPLGRPMRKENVPVLLSISILMLVFSLGIFLRFAGLELKFATIGESANSFMKNLNTRKYP